MAGLVVVFKDYNFQDGIFGSPWVGFKNFEFFFYSFEKAWRATRNTLFLNTCFIVTGTIIAVSLAIMFNEIKKGYFKKITQSLSILPYFISWVVLGGICMTILDFDKGTLNQLITSMGFEKLSFYSEPKYWPLILTLSDIWKGAGYSAIIYLSVIQGFDTAYYEAAIVDGASHAQQITRITIPLLRPTIVILTLLAVGRILYGNLTMIIGMTNLNPLLLPTTDIVDTFVYRSVIGTGEFSMASAVGLYQSIVGLFLVLVFNHLAGRFDSDYKIF
jgi:putative aldouronate transport system permease protein